jgi:hypothetical protein
MAINYNEILVLCLQGIINLYHESTYKWKKTCKLKYNILSDFFLFTINFFRKMKS